jgi:M6 family metalloprotease-like protein
MKDIKRMGFDCSQNESLSIAKLNHRERTAQILQFSYLRDNFDFLAKLCKVIKKGVGSMKWRRNWMVIILSGACLLWAGQGLAEPLMIRRGPLMPGQSDVQAELVRRSSLYRGRVVSRPKDRTRACFLAPDTIRVLALRVEFVADSDTLATGNGKMDLKGFLRPRDGLFYDPPHTKRYFERELEFLRNYYRTNSLGNLEIEYTVMPEGELDAYQLPRDMLYYGHLLYPWSTTSDWKAAETGLCRLMRDAIKTADQDPKIRFADYDKLIIFHAGSCWQTDMKGNSPYDLLAGMINEAALETYLGERYIRADEGATRITAASILPEMARQDTTLYGETNLLGMMGLQGLLVHEFAHLLGAFDLYDVTGYSMGVGGWDVMGYGGWLGDPGAGIPYGMLPALHSAFHKTYLGWVEPAIVDLPTDSLALYASEVDSARFSKRGDSAHPIILKIPVSDKEYFLIENRLTDTRHPDTVIVDREDGVVISVDEGEYDFCLPGAGVLIWHIDEDVVEEYGDANAINIFPEHKGVDLEEADGIQDFDFWSYEANSDYQILGYKFDPFFKGGYNESFGPNTSPSSDGYYGRTGIKVEVGSAPDTVMGVGVGFELYQAGFPKDLGRKVKILAPNYGDLDRDGKDELVIATQDGGLYCWRSDGTPYLGGTSGLIAWLPDSCFAPPAIGDVTGDGRLNIIIGCRNGRVYGYYGDSLYGGQLVLLPGFPVATGDRLEAAPVLADLNGDGAYEIVVGSRDMRLYCLRGDGSTLTGFPRYLGSEVRAAVAVTPELPPKIVVLGADSRIFLVDYSGKIIEGFPLVLSQSPIYASGAPVLGDLDRDGDLEVAVIAGDGAGFRLWVVNLDAEIEYQGNRPIPGPCKTSPALADLDRDGFLEVVIAAKNKLYLFNHNGTWADHFPVAEDSVYFATELVELGGTWWIIEFETEFVFNSSPLVGDFNNDGLLDIVLGLPDFGVLGYDEKGRRSLRLATRGGISSAGLILDLDQDGDLEYAVGSDSGIVYVWDLAGPAGPVEWPKFLGDPAHSGCYQDHLPAQPPSAPALIQALYAYPNPCDEHGATVRYQLGPAQTAKLSVLDISGRLIAELSVAKVTRDEYNEVFLESKSLPTGVYIIRLEVEGDSGRQVKFYKLAVVK